MTDSEQILPHFSIPVDWQEVVALYPIQSDSIWLNFCGISPISTYAIETMNDYFDEYSRFGIFAPRYSEPKVKAQIRDYLGKLLNAPPQNIGLIHNTSEGMNLYSHSIHLPPNTRILLIENEYPSNVYPWEHWKEKRVQLSFVNIGKNPKEFSENLEVELKKGDVSLISISPVHWCTGMPLDMERVSTLCKKYNVRFVIDGSQSVGHVFSDFTKLKVDFAVFAAWKWLLGPLGMGIIYISDDIPKDFHMIFKGAGSVKNDSMYLPYRDELKPPADQFEHSTANFNDWVYFLASLRMLSDIGYPKVFDRIYEISALISERLRSLGFTLDQDHFPQLKTGIIGITGYISGKAFNPEAIQMFLKNRKIYTAVRLGRLRMAPHIPVTEKHVDILESALKDYLAS